MRFGIVILAGGRATRYPGKLSARTGDEAMIARVLRNVRAASDEIVVSSSPVLASELETLVDVPIIVDREEARGPLGGMLSAFARMRSARVFAVAGDAPFVDAAFAWQLAAHWERDDEAVVPVHRVPGEEPQTQPLTALYDRVAFEREGNRILREGRGAIRLVVDALATRYVQVDGDPFTFTNVNTPADAAAFRARLRERGELHEPAP